MTSNNTYRQEGMHTRVDGKDSVVLFLVIFVISFIFRTYIFHSLNGENQVLATGFFLIISALIWISFTSISHTRHPLVEILTSFGISMLYIPIVGLFLYCAMANAIEYDPFRYLALFCMIYLVAQVWIVASNDERPLHEEQFLVGLMISIVVSSCFILIIWAHLRFFTHNSYLLGGAAADKDTTNILRTELGLITAFFCRLFIIGMKKAIKNEYHRITLYRPREDNRQRLILNFSRAFVRFWIYFFINPIRISGIILSVALFEMLALLMELFKSKYILIAAKVIATVIVILFMTLLSLYAAKKFTEYTNIGSDVRGLKELVLILKLGLSFVSGWLATIVLAIIWTESLQPALDDCLFKSVVLQLAWLICGTVLFIKGNIVNRSADEHFGLYLILGWSTGLIFLVKALQEVSHSDET